jgi:D-amino-acid dehydrogenase
MRVAVIGAGIVGIATAHELAEDGHEVTVFERHGSVATEASFANAGVLAPGYVTPWAAPGMLRKVLGQWGSRDAAVRLAGMPGPPLLAWLWRWYRACGAVPYAANRGAMLALARDSVARTQALAARYHLDHERAQGMLVLLRSEREVAQSRAGLKVLADLGVTFQLVDAAAARRIEPALHEATALKAAIHLPDAQVGNCRQFAHGLRQVLASRGVQVRLLHEVRRIEFQGRPRLHVARLEGDAASSLVGDRPVADEQAQDFDAVVVCAALGAPALLSPLRVRLPLQPVHGYSITLPVRHFETHPDVGPRSALMDERYKVALTRLGDRIRVAGSAELAGRADRLREAPRATLYRVLDDWFPSAARHARAQTWKGARPMLPDGPPAIGATAVPGIWLNTGHGSSGWALACGSARLLADLVAGRAPAVDPQRFSPLRW